MHQCDLFIWEFWDREETLLQDPVLATLVSTAIVLKSGILSETAFAIAGSSWNSGRAQILSLIRLINTTWVHMADKYAEKGIHVEYILQDCFIHPLHVSLLQ